MQKIIGLLFVLSSFGFGAIGSLTIPHDIDSAAIPKVIYIDQNNDSIVNKVNEIKDTVNAYLPGGGVYSGTSLTSTGNLRLTVDSDNNGTGNCLAMTHNGATDTIAKFCDDLSSKAFGALNVTGRTTLTDSLIGVSQRLSGNLAAANGAFSGTLGTTGLHTADGGILFASSNSGAQGKITKNSTTGLEIRGVAGSVNDVTISSADAGTIFANLTGTRNITVGHSSGTTTMPGPVTHSSTLTQTGAATFASTVDVTGGNFVVARSASGSTVLGAIRNDANTANSQARLLVQTVGASADDAFASFVRSGVDSWSIGLDASASDVFKVSQSTALGTSDRLSIATSGVTIPGTLTQTGVATFTAAPVFSSVTASQFLLVDGSKALTSVAGTGSGSVVRATSPTLVTPALGAATATSVVASGNITADSIISSKFYEEGSFTATLTGVSGTVTGTATFVRVGKMVTLNIPALSGTSNTTAMTITGMPAQIRPATLAYCPAATEIRDNGTDKLLVRFAVATSGVITPSSASSLSGFYGSLYTASGTKGVMSPTTITYTLQ